MNSNYCTCRKGRKFFVDSYRHRIRGHIWPGCIRSACCIKITFVNHFCLCFYYSSEYWEQLIGFNSQLNFLQIAHKHFYNFKKKNEEKNLYRKCSDKKNVTNESKMQQILTNESKESNYGSLKMKMNSSILVLFCSFHTANEKMKREKKFLKSQIEINTLGILKRTHK